MGQIPIVLNCQSNTENGTNSDYWNNAESPESKGLADKWDKFRLF